MFKIIILVLVLINGSFSQDQQKTCQHHTPTIDDIPHPVRLKDAAGSNREKRQVMLEEGPLRIRVFYHDSVEMLRPPDRAIIKRMVS